MRDDSPSDEKVSRRLARKARAAVLVGSLEFDPRNRHGDIRPLKPVERAPLQPPKAGGPRKQRKPKPPDDDLERQCAKLLARLEKHCPGLLPTTPLPPSETAEPIEVRNDDLQELLLTAVGVTDKRRRNQVIWELAGSELLVHLQATRVQVVAGLVMVGMTVETNETGRTEVTIPFAVGRRQQLAGMLVTTEPKPRGPTIIIDRWGNALISAAWQALLGVIGTLAARAGVDQLGNPLLPGAIVAEDNRLAIIAQAAHKFERNN